MTGMKHVIRFWKKAEEQMEMMGHTKIVVVIVEEMDAFVAPVTPQGATIGS